MEYICKYYKFGYCKLKDQCGKYHIQEECKEGSKCEHISTCPLRHPKMCKRIMMDNHCGFKKCAYNHKRSSDYQNTEINTLHEEVKMMKTEIDALKIDLKSVLAVQAEIKCLKGSVGGIKEEIQQLKCINKDIIERIKQVEEEINDDTDDECESDNDINLCYSSAKLIHKESVQNKGQTYKCNKCDFAGHTEVSFKKHMNTKHPLQNNVESEVKSMNKDCTLEGFEGIEDLFQIEVLDGEEIYACNVCNEGFDREDEIMKHISDDHKEIVIEISEDSDNKEETKSDVTSSDGDGHYTR